MPTGPKGKKHRKKLDNALSFLNACVARPVSKAEIQKHPEAILAMKKEWSRLMSKGTWTFKEIIPWHVLAANARRNNKTIHLGRIFGLMVEKGSELERMLPDGTKNPARKYKYRVVFQGNNVVDQHWETALFQDLGSSPASMDASKAADCYGSFSGHDCQQCDAEQAYIQADLEGEETWVCLPPECIDAIEDPEIKARFYKPNGEYKYDKPCVRLVKALYGHPDAGSCWERHCDKRMRSKGFKPIESWPSCYFHKELRLFMMIYVDDFKLSGPAANLAKGWELIKDAVDMGDPEPAGLFLGCTHERF